MFGIGATELVVIFVVALLIFGPKRLPELARTLGRGLGEFRRASNELRQSLALEELQQDLRRDLREAGTIHRPAQAGDSVPASSARGMAAQDAARRASPDGDGRAANEAADGDGRAANEAANDATEAQPEPPTAGAQPATSAPEPTAGDDARDPERG